MGKVPLFFLLTRSGNEWRVGEEMSGELVEDQDTRFLYASVGENPLIPPTTGWNFINIDAYKFDEDPQLLCSSTPTSSSCIITVSLSGLAKEIQRECEGEYKDTGLRSRGRKVINFSI